MVWNFVINTTCIAAIIIFKLIVSYDMVSLNRYLNSTLLLVMLVMLILCILYKFIQLILFILPSETIFWFRHFASTELTRNWKPSFT